MKLIEPKVEFLGEVPVDYEENLKFIERAGRTCYKSEDKITEDSAEKFVKKLIKAGHLAMVEHSNFVVSRTGMSKGVFDDAVLSGGKYLHVIRAKGRTYVGGNLTAWYQRYKEITDFLFFPFMNIFGEIFNIRPPMDNCGWVSTQQKEIPKELRRYSVKFICDRGVSHEIVRHRPCSFAQESTRYVTYNGDGEFIMPAGFSTWPEAAKEAFIFGCRDSLDYYIKMLNAGMRPEQARAVLPNAVKTELVVTADAAEWSHIRKLRTHKSAHPDMVRLMNMMPWEEFL